MKEIWSPVPVPGYEGLYEISTHGRIRSKDRTTRNGGGEYLKKGRLLHPVDNGSGYLKIQLKNGEHVTRAYIHRLVASAFLENESNKPFINHIDNNPCNNNVDNLEWCTHQENMDWMAQQGRNERTKEWLENLHKTQSESYKAVVGKNLDTGEVVRFENLNGVAKAGFQPSCVCNCCKGIRKTHKGYVWMYENRGVV